MHCPQYGRSTVSFVYIPLTPVDPGRAIGNIEIFALVWCTFPEKRRVVFERERVHSVLRRWLERIGAWVCWDQSLCSGFSWRPQVCCLLVSFQLSKAIWSILSVIRSIQNAQQAIRHSSVIFVAPYWNYRISCLKVQLAPLAQDADSEKWNEYKLRLY